MVTTRLCLSILSLIIMAAMISANTPARTLSFMQTRGEASLRLVITDPAGAAIAMATVRVQSGNDVQTQQTNAHGEAVFSHLAAGPYRLKVSAPGFVAREFDDNSLKPGN